MPRLGLFPDTLSPAIFSQHIDADQEYVMVSRLTLFSIGLLSLLWLRRYLLSHTQQTFHTLMTLIFSAVLFNMFEVLGGDMMRFSSWSAHTAVLNGPFSYTDRLDMLMLVSAVVW